MPQTSRDRYKRRSQSRSGDRGQSPRRPSNHGRDRERERDAVRPTKPKSRSRSREKQSNARKRSPDPNDKSRAYNATTSSAPAHHRDEGMRTKSDGRDGGPAISFNVNTSTSYEHLFPTSSSKGYGQPSTSSRGRGREADSDERVGKLSKRFGGGGAPKKIEIEENITIDIRRRHVGNEPPVIRPIDVETEFVMVHPQQKNSKPIFERPELKGLTRGDGSDPDVEVFPEQRVIRVDGSREKQIEPASTSSSRRRRNGSGDYEKGGAGGAAAAGASRGRRDRKVEDDGNRGRQNRDVRDAVSSSRSNRDGRRDSEHFEGRLEPRPGGIGARLGQHPRSGTDAGDARGIIEGRGRDRSGGDREAAPRRDQEVHFDARNLLGKRQYPFDDGYNPKAGRFEGGNNHQGLLGDAPPQFGGGGGGGGGRGGRGGGLFSKAVGGLVLERLGIRADHILGAALNNIPPHVIDPTIVPKKAYFYEHDDRGEDDWGGNFRGRRGRGFRGGRGNRGFRGRGGRFDSDRGEVSFNEGFNGGGGIGFDRGNRGGDRSGGDRSGGGVGGGGGDDRKEKRDEEKTVASAEEIDERIARREALRSQKINRGENEDGGGGGGRRDIFVRGRWIDRGRGIRGRGRGRGRDDYNIRFGGYQPSRVPSRDKWQHDMFEKEEQDAKQAEGGGGDEEEAVKPLEDIEENIEINEGGLDVQDASAFEEKEQAKIESSSGGDRGKDDERRHRDRSDHKRSNDDDGPRDGKRSRDSRRGGDRERERERDRDRGSGGGKSDRRDRARSDKDRRRDDDRRRERRSDDDRKSGKEKRHHSPDSTKVDAAEIIDADGKTGAAAAANENDDSTLPPPPSKWEKEDGAIAAVASEGAKLAQAELVTSSA